uniref:Uncharacterized protein n=1 Tax=Physcomitrium patens TaxID=3218 RepID=A0A2K1IYW1_PHYPA|nr:hypothetical protein PHYPA_024282 [Physcomitrium patens]
MQKYNVSTRKKILKAFTLMDKHLIYYRITYCPYHVECHNLNYLTILAKVPFLLWNLR